MEHSAEHDKDKERPIIIIKKVKKVHGGHHGGAWKIAYADFVTAMMTFFLLMWLLALLNKYQLQGMSEYFKTPMVEAFTKQDDVKAIKKSTTQVKLNSTLKTTVTKDLEEQNELKALSNLKDKLQKKLENDKEMSQFKNQLNFIITADGLKIVIKDLENKPMFSQGKTDFQDYAKKILTWLTKQMNEYKNSVVIIGHTDALPYSGVTNYSNWELSADRANATRRALENAGLSKDRILRVIGGADTDLLDNHDANDPSNRRIEIIMVTDKVVKQIKDE